MLSAALLACASCARAPVEVVRPAKVTSAPVASASASAQPVARATRCAAEPSTVYGSEPVVFVVEGQGAADAKLPFELHDERGHAVSVGSVAVPGQLTAPDVGSGDFLLTVGDGALRCAVTVNRELVRASQMAR